MERTSLTIGSWMVAIVFVAFDLVALGPLATSGRSLFGPHSDPFLDVVILPLAFTLQGLLVITVNRRGRIRPAWVGFQVVGWVAMAVYLGICSRPGMVKVMFDGLGNALEFVRFDVELYGRVSSRVRILRLLVATLILIAPPWCLAMAGGFLAGRLFPRYVVTDHRGLTG